MISIWDLPKTVEIFDKAYKIRDNCDYRVMLDVNEALSDNEESQEYRLHCAMHIFFEDFEEMPDPLTANTQDEIMIIQEAINRIIEVLRLGEPPEDETDKIKPKVMDWKKDFHLIAPAVNRVLGYDVRDPDKYTHWYTLVGAFGEIGDCYFAQIMNIRQKRLKGKALDEQDRQFYKEHKKDVDLSTELSEEEREWLDSDW